MTDAAQDKARLSLWQAAWVITRRDFTAVLFSRAFFFFLLGPLFPLIVGGLAGGIGGQVQRDSRATTVVLAMAPADNQAMREAAKVIGARMGHAMPEFEHVAPTSSPETVLKTPGKAYAAVVTGTPSAPIITGPQAQIDNWSGVISLIAAAATRDAPTVFPTIDRRPIATSAATERSDRIRTAQAGQLLLFLLMMLLAGMVLSNLVEEKANKVIEVLAAAIPMDAVFLGKLIAMLGVSFVGLSVWGIVGGVVLWLGGDSLPHLPPPAVGWPLFIALSIAYFAMGYLLLGSLFLTIGGMAATVREVQTLSMPVTMMQLLVFFLAAYSLTRPDSPVELVAAIFPLSSPFAMVARAAQFDALWPHVVALAWQALCVMLFIRGGATLFRRRVMKSGGGGRASKRKIAALRG